MSRKSTHVSETPATQWLRQRGLSFTEHTYTYIDHGGSTQAALQLAVPAFVVVKTLIMQDDKGQPLVVLMHGDCEVSTKNLARQIGVKQVQPCDPAVAQRHSGYLVGGTSPFGTRKKMQVWVEQSILELPLIYINGGRRGYLLGLAPRLLTEALGAQPVNVKN